MKINARFREHFQIVFHVNGFFQFINLLLGMPRRWPGETSAGKLTKTADPDIADALTVGDMIRY